MKNRYLFLVFILLALIVVFFFIRDRQSVDDDYYSPVPKASYMIDLPVKEYERVLVDNIFSFDKPLYSVVEIINDTILGKYYRISFPDFGAAIDIQLQKGAAAAHPFKMMREEKNWQDNYIPKADSVTSVTIAHPNLVETTWYIEDDNGMLVDSIPLLEENLILHQQFSYGKILKCEGPVMAANLFYLFEKKEWQEELDSYFLKGQLFFDLALIDVPLPIVNFVRKDLDHMLASFQWEYN